MAGFSWSRETDAEYGDMKAKIQQEAKLWAELEAKQKYMLEQAKARELTGAYGMSAEQFRKVFHEEKPINKVLLLL